MEHLPLAERTAPIVVPYLCREDYDGGDFMAYPERKHMSVNSWPDNFLRYDRESIKEILSFIQTWLFFGAMTTVFSSIVPTADFVRDDGERKYITTAKLQKYVEEWAYRDGKLSGTDKELTMEVHHCHSCKKY